MAVSRKRSGARKAAPAKKAVAARVARKAARRRSAADVQELRRVERANARKPDMRVVVGTLPLSQQLQRIGGSLTPRQVSSIIRDADTGYMFRLMDLANEARQKDGHLQGILYTREIGLSSTPWEIKPYIKRGRKLAKTRDRKIAEFVEDALKGVQGGALPDAGPASSSDEQLHGFQRLLSHLAGAAYYGYAPVETVWGKQKGQLIPAGFSLLQQRRFIFDQSDGRIRWWDQGYGGQQPVDIIRDFPPGKFMVHQPRINGDIACREGLVRPLMWAALFRNWTIRDWIALAELAWKPWRTGTYKKSASQEDIDALYDALQKLTNEGVGAFPETTSFMVNWPKNAVSSGQSMHGELAAFLASEMSKCVLGQTLTTEAGNKGARSLGEVHDGVRKDYAESDALAVAATIQAFLIVPLVRMNFGNDVEVPQFRFITEDKENIESFGQGVLWLQQAGTKIPQRWVREKVGMPEPEDDEDTLGGDDAEVDPETGDPVDTPPEDPNDPEAKPKPADAADNKPKPKPAAKPPNKAKPKPKKQDRRAA